MSVFLSQLLATARQSPVIATCVALTLIAGIANYPLNEERQAALREHEEMRQRGEAMLVALTDRIRINADLLIVSEAQDTIDNNLVSEDTMEVNLGYFYRLEKLNRVRLARIDQMVAPAADTGALFKTVPVSLQVNGSYRNVLAFVRDLETGPRLLRVRSYRIERGDGIGNELQLVLIVDLLAQA